MKRMLIGSTTLFSLIVVGIIAALSSGQSPKPAAETKSSEPLPPVATQFPVLLDRGQASLVEECKPLAQSFLDATTVEQIMPLVHNPETAEARIHRYYPNGLIEPQGLKDFNLGQAMQIKGNAVSFVVRNNDFDARTIVFIDGPQGLKVHWESFVGWSEMAWQEFTTQKPTAAKIFRVIVAPVEYYNFDFKDDKKWQSYSLQSSDKTLLIYGYVERESVLNFKIKLNPDVKNAPMILALKFPEAATTANQVIIESQVADGWIEDFQSP